MKELDELLERYMEVRYDSAPAAEQKIFGELLELQDPQLFAYLLGRETPEDEVVVHVIGKIRNPDA
jgi:antitoxin CptB